MWKVASCTHSSPGLSKAAIIYPDNKDLTVSWGDSSLGKFKSQNPLHTPALWGGGDRRIAGCQISSRFSERPCGVRTVTDHTQCLSLTSLCVCMHKHIAHAESRRRHWGVPVSDCLHWIGLWSCLWGILELS